jgi:hypothetical protein
VILNIHGTLLDCSLISERNPNTSIPSNMIKESRRVVFRPWLLEFLHRCFINFTMAFWGSKSESYMDEIVAAVLLRLKDGQLFKPLFVWSGNNVIQLTLRMRSQYVGANHYQRCFTSGLLLTYLTLF